MCRCWTGRAWRAAPFRPLPNILWAKNKFKKKQVGHSDPILHGQCQGRSFCEGFESNGPQKTRFCVVLRKFGRRIVDPVGRPISPIPGRSCGEFVEHGKGKKWGKYWMNLRLQIRQFSMTFGAAQVNWRSFGFKADFFAEMASALTTECVFLDGAAHPVGMDKLLDGNILGI